MRDWNVASRAWVRALDSGRKDFLARYEGYTRRMMVNSLRIRLAAAEIRNPRMRALVRRLGDAYRAQFRAVNEANRAVVAGDLAARRGGGRPPWSAPTTRGSKPPRR